MSLRPFKEEGKGQVWASVDCPVGGEWPPIFPAGCSGASGVWVCVGQGESKGQRIQRYWAVASSACRSFQRSQWFECP